MVEIIGYLTKMRFGDQEQSRAKDNKEVCVCVIMSLRLLLCFQHLVLVYAAV